MALSDPLLQSLPASPTRRRGDRQHHGRQHRRHGDDLPRPHALATAPPPPPLPPCDWRQVGHRTASSREHRGPMPDLLLQNERPSRAGPRQRAPGEEGVLEEGLRRVGGQLRAIGDQMDTAIRHRGAAPRWQEWRGVCHGLFTFIAQTLHTLYRLR